MAEEGRERRRKGRVCKCSQYDSNSVSLVTGLLFMNADHLRYDLSMTGFFLHANGSIKERIHHVKYPNDTNTFGPYVWIFNCKDLILPFLCWPSSLSLVFICLSNHTVWKVTEWRWKGQKAPILHLKLSKGLEMKCGKSLYSFKKKLKNISQSYRCCKTFTWACQGSVHFCHF